MALAMVQSGNHKASLGCSRILVFSARIAAARSGNTLASPSMSKLCQHSTILPSTMCSMLMPDTLTCLSVGGMPMENPC